MLRKKLTKMEYKQSKQKVNTREKLSGHFGPFYSSHD